jgi:hypothetical protein
MDTPAEKDYIDARLEAVFKRINGEARAHQLATDARLDKLDQTVAFGLKSVHDELNTGRAQVEANFLKNQNNQTKWLIGTIIAIGAVIVSIISVMLLQVAPKTNAPIVIYAQPQAAATPLQAPLASPPAGPNKNW